MTESEKIEFLAGQVHAFIGFATAVITSHPNPAVLAHHLEKSGQINLAHVEGQLVADEYVEGVQDIQARPKRAVEIALGQKTPPNRD